MNRTNAASNELRISDDSSSSYVESTPLKAQVDVGATTTALIQFSPTASGPLPATFALTDDGEATSTRVSLMGTGVDVDVAPTPAALNFGSVVLGASPAPQLPLQLTNDGILSLDLTLGVSPGTSFSLSDMNGAITASTVETLQPTETEDLTVTFSPSAEGSFEGIVWLSACLNGSVCVDAGSVSVSATCVDGG